MCNSPDISVWVIILLSWAGICSLLLIRQLYVSGICSLLACYCTAWTDPASDPDPRTTSCQLRQQVKPSYPQPVHPAACTAICSVRTRQVKPPCPHTELSYVFWKSIQPLDSKINISKGVGVYRRRSMHFSKVSRFRNYTTRISHLCKPRVGIL